MARYKRTYDEQIEALNGQITKTQERLDSLILQRDELVEKKARRVARAL